MFNHQQSTRFVGTHIISIQTDTAKISVVKDSCLPVYSVLKTLQCECHAAFRKVLVQVLYFFKEMNDLVRTL